MYHCRSAKQVQRKNPSTAVDDIKKDRFNLKRFSIFRKKVK